MLILKTKDPNMIEARFLVVFSIYFSAKYIQCQSFFIKNLNLGQNSKTKLCLGNC